MADLTLWIDQEISKLVIVTADAKNAKNAKKKSNAFRKIKQLDYA